MIRKLTLADLQEVMGIWLKTNQKAHGFIPAEYWSGNYEMVGKMLPQAEVYVYEKDVKNSRAAGEIHEGDTADTSRHDIRGLSGFIGITDDHIAGIFVKEEEQSRGVGKLLLDYAKEGRKKLTLQVYEKNERAIHFYQREGFRVIHRAVDEDTGEVELVMKWRK